VFNTEATNLKPRKVSGLSVVNSRFAVTGSAWRCD